MIFRRARPEDAQQMHELGESIMTRSGGYGIPTMILLPFLSIPNSEIGHVLVRDEQIIGYITLVPLTHDQIIHIMRRDEESLFHQIRIRDVRPKELAQLEPGTPIDIFIWELMSDPEQKKIGQHLLNKMFAFFHALGRRGVDIQGIYATATSREGIVHSRAISFAVVPETTPVTAARPPLLLECLLTSVEQWNTLLTWQAHADENGQNVSTVPQPRASYIEMLSAIMV